MVCMWSEFIVLSLFNRRLRSSQVRNAPAGNLGITQGSVSVPLRFANLRTSEALSLSSTGPEWSRLRSALNPKMLKLREVSAYAPVIHRVVGDLLQRIELLRSRSQDQVTVSDISAELHKFGFEGGRYIRRAGV